MTHLPTTNEPHLPADFVWGAATAAYQLEGAVKEDGRGESIWDRFSHTPGKVTNGDTGDVACDHYHRWRDDINLMRSLGLGAYRFSVAWPRVMPTGRGPVNEAGLDFYERLVDGLLAAGITPWVTLYHWDLPQILEDQGGWPNWATADAFAAYADAVSRRLGDRVKHWITFNEPWVSSFLGYYTGEHAPGKRDLSMALRAGHGLLLGHAAAVPILRANSPGSQVGITLNLTQVYSGGDRPEDQAAAARHDGYQNRWFLDPIFGRGYPADMLAHYGADAPTVDSTDMSRIAAPIDFLGINYYMPQYVIDDPAGGMLRTADKHPADAHYTEMGWITEPRSLEDFLLRLHRDYPVPPLYITENGAAYPDVPRRLPDGSFEVSDPQRVHYYAGHLAAAARAVAAGVPLKGYFAWSLMDNFEWAHGYSKRFGLVYVDYATQQRVPKDSARWYRDYIERHRHAGS
ncbi:MAG: GH1 family beta-glucosidase [Herpetosiphon sp.]